MQCKHLNPQATGTPGHWIVGEDCGEGTSLLHELEDCYGGECMGVKLMLDPAAAILGVDMLD